MEDVEKLFDKFLWSAYTFVTSRGINSRGGDITITNARIWTGDPADPWHSAMTVCNGKIKALDADEPAGKRVNAGGRLVVPGLWDSHCHPHGPLVLSSLEAPTLYSAQSAEEVLDRLRDYVKAHPKDKYPRLFGWMYPMFKEGQRPTRQMIDAVVSDRPVFLVHISGHAHWANTKALEVAGALEKDPPYLAGTTGHIERDADTGLATGLLEETEYGATDGVLLRSVRKVEPLSFEEQVLGLRHILEEYSKVGVTSIWTKDGDIDTTRLYEQLLRDDSLPVRGVLNILYTPFFKDVAVLQTFADRARELEGADLPPGFLRGGVAKVIIDLVLDSHQGWLFEPYADGIGGCGKPTFDMEHFRAQVLEADKLGLQVNISVYGDRGVYEALNVLDQVARINPSRARRHTLEHAELIHERDLPRFKELDVTASMNFICHYPGAGYHDKLARILGRERLDTRYSRYRGLLDAGALVVNGSDFPVGPIDPMLGIHFMVTGTDIHGQPEGGIWPHKRTTVEEALRTFTVNAACAAFAEDRLGLLKPGYEADFVMLSDDILDESFELTRLAWVKPVLTVLNGHVVHEDFSDEEKEFAFGFAD